jgi:membrane fusion protein (multidrug efflux system)
MSDISLNTINDQKLRPSKFKNFLKWGLLSIFVLALLGGTGFTLFMKIKFADFQPPMEPSNVVVSPVESYLFKDSIEAIGTITANESVTVTSTVTETVKAINSTEGQFIKKGDPILDLNDEEEQASLNRASQSFDRYNKLVRDNLASPERRDEEQAGYKIARAQIEERKIVAPFDGFLGIRHVDVGDLVQPGTVITTIDSLDPVKLDFTVPEVYLANIKNDMQIEATTAAYPNKIFTGKIYVINTRVDEVSRSIAVRAVMSNPEFQLKPGLLMKVKIIKSSIQSPAIPESAIISSGTKKSVFVVDNKNIVNERVVKTGFRQPGIVQIIEGISAGEKVIIEGQMKTGAGAPVKIIEERNLQTVIQGDAAYSNNRKQMALKDGFDINVETKEKKVE